MARQTARASDGARPASRVGGRRGEATGRTHRVLGGLVLGGVGLLLRGVVPGGGRAQEVAEGAVVGGQLRVGAVLEHATVLEHGHEVGPLDRPEPVGHEHAGAPREQALGGAHHALLGDRVHPGGGLVEHHHLHVTGQQAREGEQLLLPRRERQAARAEQGVQAVGQRGHPVGETQLVDDGLHVLVAEVLEERDVLRQRAGEHLGALGDRAHAPAEGREVGGAHVLPAEQHGAGRGLDGARHHRGEGGLARPGAPHQGQRLAGRHVEVDAPQREGALPVGEVQVGEAQVERPLGQRVTPDGLGLGGDGLPHADDCSHTGLELRQLFGQLRHDADEAAAHEEEGDQRGDAQVPALHGPGTPDHEHHHEQLQHQPATEDDRDLLAQHRPEAAVDLGGELGQAAHGERLAEAGAQVVPGGDALLEGRGVRGERGLLVHLELGDPGQQRAHHEQGGGADHREEEPGGPPGEPGHDPHRHNGHQGGQDVPQHVPAQRADLRGVVVDAVEQLTDRLVAQGRHRLRGHGGQHVAAQLALGAVDLPHPQQAAHGIEHHATHEGQGEPPHEGRLRVLSEATGQDGPHGLAHAAHGQHGQRHGGRRREQASPGDGTRGGAGPFGSVDGGGARGVGHGVSLCPGTDELTWFSAPSGHATAGPTVTVGPAVTAVRRGGQ